MLLKTCLVGCHPVPGDPRLNAFYTPQQNHMTSDLPAVANCPARKREERQCARMGRTFIGGEGRENALKLIRVYICDPHFPRPGKHIWEKIWRKHGMMEGAQIDPTLRKTWEGKIASLAYLPLECFQYILCL